eukprot:4116491-Alexandrium_andersonii.AAC.1
MAKLTSAHTALMAAGLTDLAENVAKKLEALKTSAAQPQKTQRVLNQATAYAQRCREAHAAAEKEVEDLEARLVEARKN